MISRGGMRKPMAGVPSVMTDSGACLPYEARHALQNLLLHPSSAEASPILATGLQPFCSPRLTLFLDKVWGKVSLCSPVGLEIYGASSSSASYVHGWYMPHTPHLQFFSLSPACFSSSYLLAHVNISCSSLLHQFSILRGREMGEGGKGEGKRRKEKKKNKKKERKREKRREGERDWDLVLFQPAKSVWISLSIWSIFH